MLNFDIGLEKSSPLFSVLYPTAFHVGTQPEMTMLSIGGLKKGRYRIEVSAYITACMKDIRWSESVHFTIGTKDDVVSGTKNQTKDRPRRDQLIRDKRLVIGQAAVNKDCLTPAKNSRNEINFKGELVVDGDEPIVLYSKRFLRKKEKALSFEDLTISIYSIEDEANGYPV